MTLGPLDRIDDPGTEPIEPTDIPSREPDEPLWRPSDEPIGTEVPGVPAPAYLRQTSRRRWAA